MTDVETLLIERRRRIAVLSFNRPARPQRLRRTARRNNDAYDGGARSGRQCPGDRRLWRGRAFSAGFDLKAGAAAAGQRGLADWRRVLEADFDFIMAFWDCPKPTIAAVHGYCIGGAFELSLACDITVAAAGTRLGAPEVKFGSGAVAMLLPFVAGAKAAKEILLTGDDHLTAERALALGIVNRVAPAGEELPRRWHSPKASPPPIRWPCNCRNARSTAAMRPWA